jgi:hypothetical protein
MMRVMLSSFTPRRWEGTFNEILGLCVAPGCYIVTANLDK